MWQGIRNEVTVRDGVAGELVGNDAAGFCFGGLGDPSEEWFRCGPVALLRQIDLENLTVLVDGSPQVVLSTADSDEDLIDEDRATEPSTAPGAVASRMSGQTSGTRCEWSLG
jgi:hypothetical protein